MGSVCCVAARDKTLPSGSRGEIVHRNAIYSPSWSFQWDSRRRVAGEIENFSYGQSHVTSTESSMELKRELGLDRGSFSGGGSLLENFGTPLSPKFSFHESLAANPETPPSDLSLAGNDNTQTQSSAESPEIVNTPAPESLSVPSSLSFTTPTETCSLSANPTPPRRARHSPRYRLSRQMSDSKIMGLKSPNCSSVSEGTPSLALSTCTNDLMTGSRCGSSDGWSMRTFSELVASSQRERWSFDSEFLGSGYGKLGESSNRFSHSHSTDLRTCGACSKLLIERSSWKSNELSVVSVLVCGHVYHAECLETLTQEANRYDPSCPICMVGEKQMSKMCRKAFRSDADMKSRSSKISRNRVVDSYLDAGFDALDHRKIVEREGKFPKMQPSSSGRSSFAMPFLRLGSKWSRSLSVNESSRNKGFWGRYHKD